MAKPYAEILDTVLTNGRLTMSHDGRANKLELEAEIGFEADERGLNSDRAIAYALTHCKWYDEDDSDGGTYTCPLCATTFSSEEKLDDHRCMISTPRPAPLIPQIGTWVLTRQDELLCVASLDTKKQTFKTVNGRARPFSSIKAFIQHEGI
jgi:hypothetical protein